MVDAGVPSTDPLGPLGFAMLDFLPFGVLIADASSPERPIVAANRAFCELTGYAPDEVLGRNCRLLYGVGTDADTVVEIRATLDEGKPFHGQILSYRKDGIPFWNDMSVRPLVNAEGRITHYLGVHVDITARRQTEEALRASEQRFRTFLEATPDHNLLLNRTGDILYINRTIPEITPEELIGQNVTALFPPEEAERQLKELDHLFETGEGVTREICFRDHWFLVRLVPVIRNGVVTEALCVNTEITEQKNTEAALRAAKSRLRLALEAGRIGTWEWNPDGRVTWDERQREVYGFPPGKLEGDSESFLEHIHPDDRQRVEAEMGQQLEQTGRCSSEFRILWPDGSVRWLVGEGITSPVEDGQWGTIYGINYDVTERKQVELELAEARDRAEAANRAKSTFLATMSHEIRTPMNGVLGMADLLLHSGLTGEQRRLVETLRSSGQALLRVLNQVLDLSKIEAGQMELTVAPFDPRRLVADAVDLVRPRALERELEIELEVRWPEQRQAVGDEMRLRQILLNYLDNAVKHTDAGTVRASLSARPADGGRWLLRLAVTDTGRGIAAPDRERLFQPFHQLEDARFRGGTGLGLAICRRLAELMGGTVGCDSLPGEGATFWAEVPVRTAPVQSSEVARPAAARRTWKGKRVLLAEDDAVNQRVAQAMLELLGVAVDLCHNGREVVDTWREGTWDAVLMDCQMPEVDGWQATCWIRAHEGGSGGHIPIVALTAHAMDTERQRCLDAGMDHILAKPITLQDLSALLDRLWVG